jgi:exodeoxyribonuclease V gamma subunit
MSLTLHPGNRIERLVDGLAAWLALPRPDPFASDLVIVNSKGLERWLAMSLAERWGVCADVRFVFPGPALEEALADVLGEPGTDDWTSGRLVWTLARLLPELLPDPAFTPLRAWVEAAGAPPADAILRLAARLAPVFETWPTWRPAEVRRWRHHPGDDWTSRLWHALASATPARNLAERADAFVSALAAGRRPRALPERVALFAPGSLAPLHVDLFAALGRARDVRVFALSPSPAPDPSHPLLASLGRGHADARGRLSAVADRVESRYVEPPSTTLLGALQGDLLHDRPLRAPAPRALDRSIVVHACPGAVREIEALREELVRRLDEDPTLEPRHVAVLTPDIDTYAPLVAAVFGDGAPTLFQAAAHPTGMPALPFAVGDRGPASENPVAAALLAVLGVIMVDRFDAPGVVDLLARAPVRARFGLDEAALAQVRSWVHESGVRWGLDEAHRLARGQPPGDRFTWRFGLDRLLLGTAMSDEAPALDRLPFGAVTGKEERAALGALADVAELLFDLARDAERPRPVRDWAGTLAALVDRALDDGSWHVHVVRTAVRELGEAAADHAAPVTLATVRGLLEGRFGLHEPGRAFLSGGITVSQLVPMRAIAFRVVALVGMNDGAFPRVPNLPSFDLLAHPRPGDRNPREDDRGLFLDTLLAARDALIVTYVGRDPTDGSERPPAAPVGELLDALGRAFGEEVRRAVVRSHPLRAFDPRGFDAAAPDHADLRHLAAARALVRARREPPAPPPAPRPFALPAPPRGPLALSELAAFLRAPVARTLGRRLGLWLTEREVALADREPLALGAGLDEWVLRNALLERRLAGDTDPASLRRREVLQARVPRGTRGQLAFAKADEAASALAARVAAALGSPRPPRDVVLEVEGRTLHGRIAPLGDAGHVRAQAGRLRDDQLLMAWVWHLALQASGEAVPTTIVASQSGARLRPLPAAEATDHLAALVRLYDAGQRGVVPLFPAASRAWAARSPTADPVTDALAAEDAAEAFQPSEAERLVLGDLAPWEPAARPLWALPELSFAETARQVWLPLASAQEAP